MSDVKDEANMTNAEELLEIQRTLALLQDVVGDPMSNRQKRTPPPEVTLRVVCCRTVRSKDDESSSFSKDMIELLSSSAYEQQDGIKVYDSHYETELVLPCTTKIPEITDLLNNYRNQLIVPGSSLDVHSGCKLQSVVAVDDLVTMQVESLCLRVIKAVNQPFDQATLTVPEKRPTTVFDLLERFSLPYYTPILVVLETKFPKQYRMLDSMLRLFLRVFIAPTTPLSTTPTFLPLADWVDDSSNDFVTTLPVAGAIAQLCLDYNSMQTARIVEISRIIQVSLYVEYQETFEDPITAHFRRNVAEAEKDAFVWDDNYAPLTEENTNSLAE